MADRVIKNLPETQRIEIATLEAQIESVQDSMVTVANPLSVPWDYLMAQLPRFGEDAGSVHWVAPDGSVAFSATLSRGLEELAATALGMKTQ